MEHRLLILGASGFGREVLWVIDDLPATTEWRVAGFLDDDVARATAELVASRVSIPLLGTIRGHQPADDELFFCAIGNSRSRLAVGHSIRSCGGRFVSLVHPSALIHPSATIGEGTIIGPLCTVGPGSRVGDFAILNASASVGSNVELGAGTFVGARTDLMDGSVLERGAFLGGHVTVHPRARVRAFTTVGIGSTVLHDLASESTYFGMPARRLA